MVRRIGNPASWLACHVPKSRGELELAARSLLKLAFWAALLAPVIVVPAYYLLVTFGILPPVHLPSG